MKKYLLSLLVAPALLLTSCGGSSDAKDGAAGSGDAITVKIADFGKDDQNGKTVTIEGYLGVSGFSSVMDGKASMKLFDRKNQTQGTEASIKVTSGAGNNSVTGITDGTFEISAVKVKSDKGEVLAIGSHVRVTGTASVAMGMGFLTVTKIEKLADEAIDYSKLGAVALTDANLAASDGKLMYIDANFSTSLYVPIDNKQSLKPANSGITSPFYCYALVGDGNSKIVPLADGASEEGLELRDNKGAVAKASNKYRVYGIWKKSELAVSEGDPVGSFYIEEIVTQ